MARGADRVSDRDRLEARLQCRWQSSCVAQVFLPLSGLHIEVLTLGQKREGSCEVCVHVRVCLG